MTEPTGGPVSEDAPGTPCARLAVPVTDADHAKGATSAPVVVVEYGDYECPYCYNAQPVVKEVRRRMGDRMAFVFRHFPQNSIHPHASFAARAAGAQGKFWEMHEQLFRHQKELADLDLTHLALNLGLEVYRFDTDMQNPAHARRIREDVAGGLRSAVEGTPTFFINGCRYDGEPDVESLLAAVGAAVPGAD